MEEKLVRDKIPGNIRANGEKPVVREATAPEEQVRFALQKVIEECKEALKKLDLGIESDEFLEEVGDIEESRKAVINVIQIRGCWRRMDILQNEKFRKNGGFSSFYILQIPDEVPHSPV